jgi:spore maturation protein A
LINYIWGLFLLIGIVYSFFTNNTLNINQELLTSGSSAIDMIIKLIPLMCLWLGVMNIASHSGLLDKMAKKISKVVNIIFPEIQDNEAISLISSNIIMNMLGLGNAATPFGLKAMKRMQELNDKKDTATRSMITFLVINTASVTIIPTTVISLRILNKSSNPTEILSASLISSFSSCFIGLLLDRLFYFIWRKKYD